MCALQDPYAEYRYDKIETLQELGDKVGLRKFERNWPEIPDEKLICTWVLQLQKVEFEDLRSHMREWAQSEPDWIVEGEYSDFPSDEADCAYRFFQSGPRLNTRGGPGVVLTYGEDGVPFSTNYVAKLSISVEEANARTQRAGLPMKFCKAE